MNVHDIKTKAKSVLENRNNIMFVFIFISVMTTIINYASQVLGGMIPFVSLFISILMLPFSHGNVVTALKTVNEKSDEVSIENEGLVGLKRFKELFFTYFIQTAFLMIIILLVCLGLFLSAKLIINENVFDSFGSLLTQTNLYTGDVSAYLDNPNIIQAATSLSGIFIVGVIVIIAIVIMYSLMFALTPYVLEKYKITGAKAMSESARLMKGYKKTLFTLYLSYLGWYVLTVLITAFIQVFIPGSLISSLVMAVLMVYLFSAEMQTSIAVLFEEIDLEDKKIV